MFDWFFEFIKNNEFAGGGLLMVIAGYLGTIAYRVLPLIYNFIKRKTVLEVEIANDNILSIRKKKTTSFKE